MQCSETVSELIGLIWDFERIRKTMREMNLDPDTCPLGQLTRTQIHKGYRILKNI